MYYSYVEIEYIATSFSPARTNLALKLISVFVMGLARFECITNIKLILGTFHYFCVVFLCVGCVNSP
jgi:hypothetical protein